ncbi:hypothetical protein H0H92_009244 [Tricholoma furcatifolium]|nr:hypothetical protein H0H92_009244 [Tricholoma furcatifolium]
MGGAASKVGRKLPKRTETPSWAGVRTHPSHRTPDKPLRDIRASESRTREIERDAQDPDFIASLNRLGPSASATAKETTQLFQSSAESEHEASSTSPVHNRLHSTTLSDLLDKRKAARSPQDVERLAKQFGIDAAKLESLARFVSSPSVQSGTEQRTVEKDGEESITIQAVWIDPHLQK